MQCSSRNVTSNPERDTFSLPCLQMRSSIAAHRLAPPTAALPDSASASSSAAATATTLDATHTQIAAHLMPLLPLDLQVKYGVSLLHMGRMELGEPYLVPLLTRCDVSMYSDLFWDAGDAYLHAG
jgi:hypothetical protein